MPVGLDENEIKHSQVPFHMYLDALSFSFTLSSSLTPLLIPLIGNIFAWTTWAEEKVKEEVGKSGYAFHVFIPAIDCLCSHKTLSPPRGTPRQFLACQTHCFKAGMNPAVIQIECLACPPICLTFFFVVVGCCFGFLFYVVLNTQRSLTLSLYLFPSAPRSLPIDYGIASHRNIFEPPLERAPSEHSLSHFLILSLSFSFAHSKKIIAHKPAVRDTRTWLLCELAMVFTCSLWDGLGPWLSECSAPWHWWWSHRLVLQCTP